MKQFFRRRNTGASTTVQTPSGHTEFDIITNKNVDQFVRKPVSGEIAAAFEALNARQPPDSHSDTSKDSQAPGVPSPTRRSVSVSGPSSSPSSKLASGAATDAVSPGAVDVSSATRALPVDSHARPSRFRAPGGAPALPAPAQGAEQRSASGRKGQRSPLQVLQEHGYLSRGIPDVAKTAAAAAAGSSSTERKRKDTRADYDDASVCPLEVKPGTVAGMCTIGTSSQNGMANSSSDDDKRDQNKDLDPLLEGSPPGFSDLIATRSLPACMSMITAAIPTPPLPVRAQEQLRKAQAADSTQLLPAKSTPSRAGRRAIHRVKSFDDICITPATSASLGRSLEDERSLITQPHPHPQQEQQAQLKKHHTKIATGSQSPSTAQPQLYPLAPPVLAMPPKLGTAVTSAVPSPTSATSKSSNAKVHISSFSFSSIARKVKRRSTIVTLPRESGMKQQQERRPSMPQGVELLQSCATTPQFKSENAISPFDMRSKAEPALTGNSLAEGSEKGKPASVTATITESGSEPSDLGSPHLVTPRSSESTLNSDSESEYGDYDEEAGARYMAPTEDTMHAIMIKGGGLLPPFSATILQRLNNSSAEDVELDQCPWIEEDGSGQYAANILYI